MFSRIKNILNCCYPHTTDEDNTNVNDYSTFFDVKKENENNNNINSSTQQSFITKDKAKDDNKIISVKNKINTANNNKKPKALNSFLNNKKQTIKAINESNSNIDDKRKESKDTYNDMIKNEEDNIKNRENSIKESSKNVLHKKTNSVIKQNDTIKRNSNLSNRRKESINDNNDKAISLVNNNTNTNNNKEVNQSCEIKEVKSFKANQSSNAKNLDNNSKIQSINYNINNNIKNNSYFKSINSKEENIPLISKLEENYLFSNAQSNKERPSKKNNNNIINKYNSIIESNNHIITDVEVQENPRIELEEVEGNILNGEKIEICATGMIHSSIRQANDGISYFGITNNNNTGFKEYTKLDFVLNLDSLNTASNVIFKVFFDKKTKKYFISSNIGESDKTILFVRIERVFAIKRKHIVSLGDIHISVETDSNNSLKIEIVSGNEESKSKLFKKETSGMIKLGRNKDNEIVLNNTAFSRIQTSFYFDSHSNCWMLQDGNGDKKSRNGTWIYLDDDWEIDFGVYFRIGSNFLNIRRA